MLILGVNAFHADSAACLLENGSITSAVEEERFRRIKHWAGFPSEAIRFCLKDRGVGINELDAVALNGDPGAARWRKAVYVLSGKSGVELVLEKLRTRKRRRGIRDELEKQLGMGEFGGRVEYVEHHLAHLASAFLVSSCTDAVALSVDGFGDFCSTAWGSGSAGGVSIDRRIYFPHSMGVFYQAMTQFLGFPNYGDEYKVMGLASHGQPRFVDKISTFMYQNEDPGIFLNLEYFRHHCRPIGYEWENDEPRVGELFSNAMEDVLGSRRLPGDDITQRHKDLATSTQAVFENVLFDLMERLHEHYDSHNLTLAGGCALNSVANGKVYERTPFRNLFVQPAPGDAGGAIGAALVAHSRLVGSERPSPMEHAYTGPGFTDARIRQVLESSDRDLVKAGIGVNKMETEETILQSTVRSLADGDVVGWFQGRLEWGPRALGNRSILCDPRRVEIKDLLNTKIKRRESFRPFAPSILRERVSEWFEVDDDVPFMEKVFKFRPEKRSLVPGVVHTDGSGRLQTVTRDSNPLFYALIYRFFSITGIPMLLNTSFNENEPMVCTPEDALDCFLRTDMDVLVLGDYVLRRSERSATARADTRVCTA